MSQSPKTRSAEQLWVKLAKRPGSAAHESLGPEVERLARAVADLFARTCSEREELFHVVLLALVKIVYTFEPLQHGSFAAFATPRLMEPIRRYKQRRAARPGVSAGTERLWHPPASGADSSYTLN